VSDEMLRSVLQSLGKRAKRDPSFAIDDAVSVGAMAGFSLRRTVMAVRGAALGVRTGRWVYPVFVGRGVVVTDAAGLHLSPGVSIGDFCRLDCLGRAGITLGPGTTLRRGAHIEVTSTLQELAFGCEIGARVGIGEGSFVSAKGPVTIGDETNLGPGCKIIAENHTFADLSRPIREQKLSRLGVTIGRDCWLGANAVVLDGCSVGDGAVVAAGAVVTGDVRPATVVAGVPARALRGRQAAPEAAPGMSD
jgi:acetyltransferase-like isoleucine patch superfamily enzyme